MNKIKKLFSKQSDDNSDEIIPLKAQMICGIDQEGEFIVDYNYEEGCEENVATLLFCIYSGYLSYFVAQTLPQYINDKEKMQIIVENTTQLIEEYNKQNQQMDDQPVVDPMDVFNTRVDNDSNQ